VYTASTPQTGKHGSQPFPTNITRWVHQTSTMKLMNFNYPRSPGSANLLQALNTFKCCA